MRCSIALHVGRGRHDIVIVVCAHSKHVLILMMYTEGYSCFDGTFVGEIITCASKGKVRAIIAVNFCKDDRRDTSHPNYFIVSSEVSYHLLHVIVDGHVLTVKAESAQVLGRAETTGYEEGIEVSCAEFGHILYVTSSDSGALFEDVAWVRLLFTCHMIDNVCLGSIRCEDLHVSTEA